jgi:hypothetical protein
MCACVVLALVVCEILLSRVPADVIHFLGYFVSNPEKSHFHRSRTLAFHSVIRDPDSRRIIAVDGSLWLGMSHVFKCLAENYAVLAIVE